MSGSADAPYPPRVASDVRYVEGWRAIAWIAGTGGALILCAAILWAFSCFLVDAEQTATTYREQGRAGSNRRRELRGLALVLVGIAVVTQLLYGAVYVELVAWLLGGRSPPRAAELLLQIVVLVDATCAVGACWAALEAKKVRTSS